MTKKQKVMQVIDSQYVIKNSTMKNCYSVTKCYKIFVTPNLLIISMMYVLLQCYKDFLNFLIV